MKEDASVRENGSGGLHDRSARPHVSIITVSDTSKASSQSPSPLCEDENSKSKRLLVLVVSLCLSGQKLGLNISEACCACLDGT